MPTGGRGTGGCARRWARRGRRRRSGGSSSSRRTAATSQPVCFSICFALLCFLQQNHCQAIAAATWSSPRGAVPCCGGAVAAHSSRQLGVRDPIHSSPWSSWKASSARQRCRCCSSRLAALPAARQVGLTWRCCLALCEFASGRQGSLPLRAPGLAGQLAIALAGGLFRPPLCCQIPKRVCKPLALHAPPSPRNRGCPAWPPLPPPLLHHRSLLHCLLCTCRLLVQQLVLTRP